MILSGDSLDFGVFFLRRKLRGDQKIISRFLKGKKGRERKKKEEKRERGGKRRSRKKKEEKKGE